MKRTTVSVHFPLDMGNGVIISEKAAADMARQMGESEVIVQLRYNPEEPIGVTESAEVSKDGRALDVTMKIKTEIFSGLVVYPQGKLLRCRQPTDEEKLKGIKVVAEQISLLSLGAWPE